MTNDLPSVGTEDARRVSEADLADLMALHKLTSEGVWAQGQTSHHTIAKREGRDDYRVAEFHHAADASFVDVAHKYMPMLIADIRALVSERDELASRVRELEAKPAQQDAVDAGRYRWLRKCGNVGGLVSKNFTFATGYFHHEEDLDARIDAAISASKGTP